MSQNDVSARKARVTSEIESLRNAVALLESDLRHSQEATAKLGQSYNFINFNFLSISTNNVNLSMYM